MKIISDVIASVRGPGFNYPLARLLFEESGTVAVFAPPGKEPTHVFIADPGHLPSIRGTGQMPEGGVVSWQRRGASCTFKLAKCNVKTTTLVSRWKAVS